MNINLNSPFDFPSEAEESKSHQVVKTEKFAVAVNNILSNLLKLCQAKSTYIKSNNNFKKSINNIDLVNKNKYPKDRSPELPLGKACFYKGIEGGKKVENLINKNDESLSFKLQNVNVNRESSPEKTLLSHAAVPCGNSDITETPINMGLNVNQCDVHHRTLLALAIMNKNLDFAKKLLTINADPNIADDRGWTTLHIAANNNLSEEAVQMLIMNGANPNAKTQTGCTSADVAVIYRNYGLAQQLISAGGELSQSTLFEYLSPTILKNEPLKLLVKNIAADYYNKDVDLSESFPKLMENEDFKSAIEARRIKTQADFSNQHKTTMSILKGHTKRNANLAFDILPENILSLISQFAIEVPSALPIADFMFPDQPKEQRQPSFENWFNRLEAQHAIGIEDHYGTASSNASLENLK